MSARRCSLRLPFACGGARGDERGGREDEGDRGDAGRAGG